MSDFPATAPKAIPIIGPAPLIVAKPISVAEPITVAEPIPVLKPPRERHRYDSLGGLLVAIPAGIEWLFGLLSLLVGLAVLASLPILQFLTLGYLLESAGRIARTGRFGEGFIGIRLAARFGGIVLFSWLLLLPVRIVADWAHSAEIIDPGSPAAEQWRIGLYALSAAIAMHILTACARGGKIRYFFWPFNFIWLIQRAFKGGYYAEARDNVWDMTVSLRIPYYFWLGLRGFAAALAWLALPVTLIAAGRGHFEGAGFLAFVGSLLLIVVVPYLPFLQARLAAENRFSAGFEVLAVRRDFRKAPWAFAIAFIVTALFAIPLYLFKIETVPREAAWLPGLVFMVFIYPARLLTGWALSRAKIRTEPRHWFFRWTGRFPMLPVAAFYVLIVFFSQYTNWTGVWSLYEQHAFLVPVPFLGV